MVSTYLFFVASNNAHELSEYDGEEGATLGEEKAYSVKALVVKFHLVCYAMRAELTTRNRSIELPWLD